MKKAKVRLIDVEIAIDVGRDHTKPIRLERAPHGQIADIIGDIRTRVTSLKDGVIIKIDVCVTVQVAWNRLAAKLFGSHGQSPGFSD